VIDWCDRAPASETGDHHDLVAVVPWCDANSGRVRSHDGVPEALVDELNACTAAYGGL
jgi:hypothetical protein